MNVTITLRVDTATTLTLVIVAVVAALVVLAGAYLPPAVDWDRTYRPAAQTLLRAESPYAAEVGFYNPPWTLLPLAPFVAAREAGRGAVCIVALGALALVSVRLGASPVAAGLFLTSPPVLHSLLNGNLEWLVLLGVILPPRWGLFLLAVKPQVAGGLAVYWAVESWRKAGWRGLLRLAGPVAAVFVLSLLLYGVWPLQARHMPDLWWNASLWVFGPTSAILSAGVGLALLGVSIWKRAPRAALAASPFLSPYVLLHAWAGALVALVNRPWLLSLIWLSLWGLVVMAI